MAPASNIQGEDPGGSGRRHWAWLAGGAVLSFLVPFVLADRIELQRDLYYGSPIAHAGLHVAAVTHSYETDLFLPPH